MFGYRFSNGGSHTAVTINPIAKEHALAKPNIDKLGMRLRVKAIKPATIASVEAHKTGKQRSIA